MTNFEDFQIIITNLVTYFTGTTTVLAFLLTGLLFLTMIVRGLDFRYATIFTLPLLGFFAGVGWFGTIANSQWIINLGLIVVAFFYGAAIIKLTS